jgi:hypothetical protein
LAIIVLTLNQSFVAISLSFTGSPIHPPSRCSQTRTRARTWWSGRWYWHDQRLARHAFGCRGCARGTIFMEIWWLSLKSTMHYEWWVLMSLGLKTRGRRFRREPTVARGVTAMGAWRQSNFVWSMWSLDQKSRSWSILLMAEWIDSM